MKSGKSKTLVTSEISEILFWVFLFPSFRFCPIAKIENLDLKILEKNFLVFRDFQVFWVFELARNLFWFQKNFTFSFKGNLDLSLKIFMSDYIF